MTQFKFILIGSIAIAGSTASLVIQHQAQIRLRANESVLHQQVNQLAALQSEHKRLSNRLAQGIASVAAGDPTAEMMKLRSQAHALRKQANELAKQRAEDHRWRPVHTESRPDSSSGFHRSSPVGSADIVSDSNSDEYRVELYKLACAAPHSLPLSNNRTMDNARHLSSAVRTYAREHQGEFPTTFDQVGPYLNLGFYKDYEPPRSSQFEMVYQGSLSELTNVPLQVVALIREQQAWPTPRGMKARIYVMAAGEVKVVESDDNFQSWEAEHIIPPPSTGQSQ
jgi:hypothetical protein